ncbi:MAG TPA: putative colanic acid biosynthesis acetyltransferase [Verrucomicrobiae bacterium]|nr:putative colanic acid biosynthesis acetyltransferase [Verrucomicrobiae bacterium]
MNRGGTRKLDIAANRAARKYTARETLLRAFWVIGAVLFRISPRPCFGWRRWLLRRFGAAIGREVHLDPTCRISMPWNLAVGDWTAIGEDVLIYNLGRIEIGERVTISHKAHLCAGTHNYRCEDFPLLKPPIEVGDLSWICSSAFIGPGVRIGIGAVVGAAAVVTRDISAWSVVAGNPALQIGSREILPTSHNLNKSCICSRF